MNAKERIKMFSELVQMLNQCDDVETLSLALAASKFSGNVSYTEREITVEVPKVIQKEVHHWWPESPTIRPYYTDMFKVISLASDANSVSLFENVIGAE